MKIFEKVKKEIVTIVLSIVSFPNKIFAQDLYGPPPIAPLYGPPNPNSSTLTIIWRIAKFFVVPIVLLAGLSTYFKKSKSSKKKRILVTIGILGITVILYFVINKVIY